jgi:Cu(I)/Ag(I) efflux system membrane fusion protein
MKNRLAIIMFAVIISITGVVFSLSKTGFIVSKNEVPQRAMAQQSPSHEGHGGTPPAPQPSKEQAEAAKAETEEEAPTIEILPEKQQMIGVKTTEVSVRPLEKVIRTVGKIEYDERKLATVNTKVEGWIEKLYVDYTGKYVKKGEPLVEIYSPELMATQQEFLDVIRWTRQSEEIKDKNMYTMLSKDAETVAEAAKQRLRLWDISDDQIKKIAESGTAVRTLTIYSPVNGYVVQKMAIQGMRVMPGEKLFDMADLSTVWIISDIYEYELPFVKVGEMAKLSLSYLPGKEFASRIDYVYPTLAGETRTAKVRFTIGNPGGHLKPEMFTNVEVRINLGKRLAIPDDAVIDTGTRQIVYLDKGEGIFEPREVLLGIRAEGFREVVKGLKAADKVASSATFLIDSEAQLKGVTPLGGPKH